MDSAILLTTQSFSPVGNVLVMAISILLIYLIAETFVTRDLSFRLFRFMLILCLVATMADQFFRVLVLRAGEVPDGVIYFFRFAYHFSLFIELLMYLNYVAALLLLTDRMVKRVRNLGTVVIIALMAADILGTVFGYGYHIEGSTPVEGFPIFAVAYVILVGMILYLIFRYRSRMIPQVFRGIAFTYVLCIILLGMQGRYGHTSFTTAVFLLPIISLMYLLHSNPYDADTGAVNEASFENAIRNSYTKGFDLMLLSLHLIDFEGHNSFTPEMRFEVYHFFSNLVKKGVLFRVSGGRLVLAFRLDQNPNHWNIVEQLERSFDVLYRRFHMNFKVVVTETTKEISKTNDYVNLIQFIEHRIPMNVCYHVTDTDISQFTKEQYIVSQLEDIAEHVDLNDPRVLTYCQPVYNVNTGKYDTAEALMRLELPGAGFIFPDQFIPVAEKHALIHALSLIILNKTCVRIREMMDEGLYINRVSINFSIPEMRDENFSKEVIEIIEKNRVPYEKIAVEITESRNETDFDMIKDRIEELRAYGIKFYLDDFGTGYSNFDRIMELPFDIIKFDRSLVIESGRNTNSEYMVNSFADMFHKLNYKVLYEGVEDENDESRCIKMRAQYLQGYKYSKPIPIEQLKSFLSPDEGAA